LYPLSTEAEIEILQVERKIRTRVKKQMERGEKEYYLNEQMRAIQKELGDKDDVKNDLSELEDKLNDTPLPQESRERLQKELKKLNVQMALVTDEEITNEEIEV